ncbi:hypothetical protein JST97_36525 [bacterium]|nr:hypothetical protein [bacterium]
MSKTCSCGAQFSLHVELAVHRIKTGHSEVELRQPAPSPVPAGRRASKHWKKTVLAGAMLISILGFSAGVSASIRTYTSWSQTANVLLLP